MNVVQVPSQDTVTLTLTGEKTVVNKSVKLVASISAIVSADIVENKLRSDIIDMMKRVIDTDWQFSSLTRSSHDSGLEEVALIASARVSETENHHLDDRRKAASRAGLSIISINADTSIPQAMLTAAESDLRIEMIEVVKTEQKKIEDAIGRKYRIGNLQFSSVSHSLSNSRAASVIGKASYGTGFTGAGGSADENDSLGNASKISLSVSVQLSTDATL